LVIRSTITSKWRRSTQRGRTRTITIDAPGVHEHLGRFDDVDAMMDTERAFERYRRERPELTEAFVDGASAIDVARAGLATRLGAYAARAGLRRVIAG
jgi:predicted dehydrogenase